MVEEIQELRRRVEDLESIGSFRIKLSDADVSNPPTDAELDSALGDAGAGSVPDGFVGIVDDAGAGTTLWLCVVKNSAWWYEGLTKAT